MTLQAAQAVRAKCHLDTLVRVNGGAFMTRRALVENRVKAGARVTLRKNGERVLMNPDGSWLDAKAITQAGLDYAYSLSGESV